MAEYSQFGKRHKPMDPKDEEKLAKYTAQTLKTHQDMIYI